MLKGKACCISLNRDCEQMMRQVAKGRIESSSDFSFMILLWILLNGAQVEHIII